MRSEEFRIIYYGLGQSGAGDVKLLRRRFPMVRCRTEHLLKDHQ
jgi:hypothetical protein